MGRSSSTFDRNYALFMEKCPKLALLLTRCRVLPPRAESLSSFDLSEVDLLYFYGVGQGEPYLLVKNWLHENPLRRLIFLSDDFCPFLQGKWAQEILLDPQVVLESSSEIEALAEKFPMNRVEVACLPSLRTKKFYALRLEIFRKTTLSYSLHIDRLYGYQPFTNFLQNIRHLPHSFYAHGLKGRFQNVPAVVCGAGPSLQRAIASLKSMENKALLIAGGSTLAALSSQGVTPHFGMGIDPNLEELRRLKNSFAFEVPFLYSTRIFPGVFHTCNGPFGYMRSGIGGLLELWMEEELGLIDPLLGENLSSESISVTTICLAWAQFLGCNPIFLSGVDLAYTDGKGYASGVVEEEAVQLDSLEKIAPSRIVKRKDRLGRPVFTAVRWVMESASISHFASMHPEVTFINTTEGGLSIKGVEFQSLDQIEERLPLLHLRQKVQEEIFRSPMPSNTSEIIETQLKKLFDSLDKVVVHLEVLAQKDSPLDELDLEDEIAYSYLFYDIHPLLEKEMRGSICPREKWGRFLQLAKKYQEV